jgi:protocatechuate 3,4-dioxygenase beta subunit
VDESGQWQLPSLPPGEYELHAWHPDRGETHVAVHVPARGDTLVRLRW